MRTIRYNISQEHMISRLPALFAYIETDVFGKSVLHKATDAPMGCYGKVVENINVNGETMTYRTLMTQYYDIKDTDPENAIVAFVDRAIGKIEVTGINFERCPLCPEYVYIATIPYLYDEYVKMKKICENGNKNDAEVCCVCDRYAKMGGDDMLEFLSDNFSIADTIAEEYFQCVSEKRLSIDLNINLVTSENDMGIVTPYIEQYQIGRLYETGDVVARNEDGIWGIYKIEKENVETTGKWDEDLMGRVFDDDNFVKQNEPIYNIPPDSDFSIEGQCDSLLKSLRRNKEYLNTYDEVERPSFGRDWLFYYRVGNVSNVRSIKDKLGNIMCINSIEDSSEHFLPMSESNMKILDGYIVNLYAYGDVITDIHIETVENYSRLIIKYMTDTHLKAELKVTDTDDDGNELFMLGDFIVDMDSSYGKGHGIEYTEMFAFDTDGELNELIKSGHFNEYVNSVEDYDDLYKKYEFITDNAVNTINKRIGLYNNIKDSFNVATFKTNGMIPTEVQSVKLFRHDYYQGISYAPSRDISVEIDRGYTSAFEKHIKFSEVNTLEDMENGNFFKISE